MVQNPAAGGAGRNRLSRRPFGPREYARDVDHGLSDDEETLSSPAAPSIPWAYPSETSSQTAVSETGLVKTVTSRRPLPPKPRTYFNDARKRPLPSASTIPQPVETKDIPFLFSTRASSSRGTDGQDPIKDPFGTPGGVPSDASIWKSYMDEARRHDHSNIQNWNQNMDVILIFAGLFSAILTAFLIDLYKPLQPDLQQDTVDQLHAIAILLEASLSGRNSSSVAIPSLPNQPFQPKPTTVVVNILLFASLTFSLGAAMGAMVIKQWLQFYTLGMSPNPYEFAHQHQYRYDALLSWHVPDIISALPFIMLFSVALFLTGLGIHLLQLNLSVAAAAIGCMAALFLCYTLSLALSLVYPSCPYKTSAMQLWQAVGTSVAATVRRVMCLSTGMPKAQIHLPPTVNDLEVQEIRAKQGELAVNGLTWLLGSSQQETIIQDVLLSVSEFTHTDDMVQKLQACHTMDQLVQRVSIPLPAWGHGFWRELEQLSPAHPIFQQVQEAKVYMKILMSIWHHPIYLSQSRPHPISERHSLERKRKALELKSTPDLSYTCLLGDWLLLWRLLRALNEKSFASLVRSGYDLNTYAYVVCIEVCHYHLQKDVTPLYLPQNRGAFIDLHDLLQAVHDHGEDELGLTEDSVCLLLDTMAYVFSGIENAPLELQGIPRTWFSPSQSPSLTRKETVLLLVQLLEKNRMRYNLTSKKLVLCLQMLLPVPMIAASRRAFFLKYQQESPSEAELFEQMAMTLQGLMHVFVPLVYAQSPPTAELNLESHFPIASLALRLLLHSIIRVETPSYNHHSLFYQLPAVYVDSLLTYLASNPPFLQNATTVQISWLLELLTKWHQNGTLSHPNINAITTVFINATTTTTTTTTTSSAGIPSPTIANISAIATTGSPPRPDAELKVIVRKTFQFLGGLWKISEPFYGQLVSRALGDILYQSFACVSGPWPPLASSESGREGTGSGREIDKGPAILDQFIQMQAFGAIMEFLESEECTEKVRNGWVEVVRVWEEKAGRWYTPSAQEVFQLEGLKKAVGYYARSGPS